MSKNIAKLFAACAAASLMVSAAHAASTTNTFQSRITIEADCEITSPTTLDFGNSGLLNSNIDQTSSFIVKCTQGTDYEIALDAGTTSGGTTTTRKMTDGNGNTVDYEMYSDSGRSSNWGNTSGSDTVASTGTGTDQSFTVYGRVPPQATPPAGDYTDTVTITVSY